MGQGPYMKTTDDAETLPDGIHSGLSGIVASDGAKRVSFSRHPPTELSTKAAISREPR